MPPLPVLKGKKVVRIFEKFGWEVAREKEGESYHNGKRELDSYSFYTKPQRSSQRYAS